MQCFRENLFCSNNAMKMSSLIKKQTVYISEHIFPKEKACTQTHIHCKNTASVQRQEVQSGYILMPGLFVYLDIFQVFYSEHDFLKIKFIIESKKLDSKLAKQQNKKGNITQLLL